MTGGFGDFVEYRDLPNSIWVKVANGQRLEVKGRGIVRSVLDQERSVKLTDVLFVPNLNCKIVSVPALTVRGVPVQFDKQRAHLMVTASVVAVIHKIGKLFVGRVAHETLCVVNAVASDSTASMNKMLWHARLGHVSEATFALVRKACDGVPSLGDSRAHDGAVCGGCARSKMIYSP